ncbi:hypothetical protein FQZ97_596570 [compost metagenome]
MVQHHALGLAVLGDQHQAGVDGRTDAIQLHRAPVHQYLATRGWLHSGDGADHFAAPGADHAGNAEHFATANREGNVAEAPGSTAKPAHRQHFLLGGSRDGRE